MYDSFLFVNIAQSQNYLRSKGEDLQGEISRGFSKSSSSKQRVIIKKRVHNVIKLALVKITRNCRRQLVVER